MKMFVGLVLFAAFALPAAFAAQQDVITLQAYEGLLKSGDANGMTKTVISSPVLEEALVSYSKKKLGGLPVCGETCFGGTCNTPGCTCDWPVCNRNSLESTKSANPLLEEALTAFAKKGNLGGLPVCGETCFGGTCNTPGCTCDWPVCNRNSLESTKSANPLLEEALTAFAKKGNLGGIPVCGETCFGGTCNTPGCTCDWPVCNRNSLESTKSANPLLEEALTAFAKKGNLGGLPVCGETCFGGTCNTPGCTCDWPVCNRNSLAM